MQNCGHKLTNRRSPHDAFQVWGKEHQPPRIVISNRKPLSRQKICLSSRLRRFCFLPSGEIPQASAFRDIEQVYDQLVNLYLTPPHLARATGIPPLRRKSICFGRDDNFRVPAFLNRKPLSRQKTCLSSRLRRFCFLPRGEILATPLSDDHRHRRQLDLTHPQDEIHPSPQVQDVSKKIQVYEIYRPE